MPRPDDAALHMLEVRIEARLQAVSARFVGVDERCAALDQRLTAIESAGVLDTRAVAEITAAVTAELLRHMARSTGQPDSAATVRDIRQR